MRWFELLGLLTVGALFGGAYLLGWHAEALGIMAPSISSTFDDTYYVQAHFQYFRYLLGFITVVFAMFLLILRLGQVRLRAMASVATILCCVGLLFSVFPQFFLSRSGMPQRYIDYTEGFALWNFISSAGSLITMCATALLIVLVLFTFWHRFSTRPA